MREETHPLKLTMEKWGETYNDVLRGSLEIDLVDSYVLTNVRIIERFWRIPRAPHLFLEAGCGSARTSLVFAKKGITIVGLDITKEATRLAKKIFRTEDVYGEFICGDINNMPFKDEVFDAIFAGGAIEHFENTLVGIKEIARIGKSNGIFVATVPLLSLGTLFYYQLSGNIPDIPVIHYLTKFLHIRLLRGRLMKYGYEKSFTESKLKKIFRMGGFSEVKSGLYVAEYDITFFKKPWIKRLLRKLARLRPFWPMVYIKGKKTCPLH